MITIGFDPGLSGAIAAVDADGHYLEHVTMPVVEHVTKTKKRSTGRIATKTNTTLDIPAICQHLDELKQKHGTVQAFIERQFPMPGQGLGSTAKTMMNFGLLLGLLHGFGIPAQVVSAREWQKSLLDQSIDDTKAASIAAVKAWRPDIDLRRTKRSKLDHDGIADALNIARHGHSLFTSQQRNSVITR